MRGARVWAVVAAVGLASGVVTLAPATASASSAPVVTADPQDVEVSPGSTASFTSEASGDPSPDRQWEVSLDDGVSWQPVVGATGSSLEVPSVTLDQDGDRYRASYTSAEGAAASAVATLQVTVVPTITLQPVTTAAAFGSDATFLADADRYDRVVWERQTSGSSTWEVEPGSTGPTLTVVASQSLYLMKYRATFFDGSRSAVTQAATLAPYMTPTITSQPVDVSARTGEDVTLSVGLTGFPWMSPSWQRSTDGGLTWSTWRGASPFTYSFSGTTSTMRYELGNVDMDDIGLYRLTASHAYGAVTSDPVELAVAAPAEPVVTEEPVAVSLDPGGMAVFASEAVGDPSPARQWEMSTDDGATWEPIAGETQSALVLFPVASSQDGQLFRAVYTNDRGTAISTSARLLVYKPPTVTQQPADALAGAGQTATFVANADRYTSVRWDRSTNGGSTWVQQSGTSRTLTVSSVTTGMNGYRYRARFLEGSSSTTTESATLSVFSAPVIATQPTDQLRAAGSTANFGANATGVPAPTYRWQRSTDGGGTWTDLSATTTTLSLTSVSLADEGLYRIRASNIGGEVFSAAASLRIGARPTVTRWPATITALAGSVRTITATVGGSPTPTIRWQESVDSGATWTDLAETGTTLTLTLTEEMHGNRYRAIVANVWGEAVSDYTLVNVGAAPVLTTNASPTTRSLLDGDTLVIATAVTGVPAPSVQWRRRPAGSSSYEVIAGADQPTLTRTFTAAESGSRYYAVFTNRNGSVVSAWVTVTVGRAPTITTQPVDQVAGAGQTFTISAVVDAHPAPTYAWQRSQDGGATWSTVSTGASYSASLSQAGTDVRRYRVVATNQFGSVTSDVASVSIFPEPLVLDEPEDDAVVIDGTARFEARGGGAPWPTVQWQQSTDGGTTWTDLPGATATRLDVPAPLSLDGYRYRAVFTNDVGVATSRAAVLRVGVPTITVSTDQPYFDSVAGGLQATFTATVSGAPAPTITWGRYRTIHCNPNPNCPPTIYETVGTGPTLVFPIPTGGYFWSYYVGAENELGRDAVSFDPVQATDPAMVAQPQAAVAAVAGESVVLTASASGSPLPGVRWERSLDGGVTWSVAPGSTSGSTAITPLRAVSSLTFPAVGGQARYRAVFESIAGSVTSSVAVVTASDTAGPTVVLSPSSASASLAGAFGGPVDVAVAASDPSGVASVHYELTGAQTAPETELGADTGTVTVTAVGTTIVRAWAVDSLGNASAPVEVAVQIAEVLSAPRSVRAATGSASATVSWVEPVSGTPIAGYVVTPFVGGVAQPATVVGAVTSAVVPGLVDGVSYTFKVAALNARGTGPAGTSSALVVGAPSAPTGQRATGGAGQATVFWTAPVSSPAGPVSGYVVTPFVGGVAQPATVVGPVTSAVVSGLANGVSYTFRVAAVNAAGTGPTASTSPLVLGAPSAPRVPRATGGAGQATVSWTAPVSSPAGPVSGYVVTPFVGAVAQPATVVGPVTSAVVSGLANGVSYTFKVAAVNAAGTGPAATTPALVLGVPSAPTGQRATGGAGQATVSWTAPVSSPAGPVSGYVVTPFVGGVAQPATVVGPVTSAVVSGLMDGVSYTFKVAAVNAAGTGPATTTSAVVVGAPTAPTGQGASRLAPGTARVRWNQVTAASPVFGYQVTPVVGNVAQAPVVVGVVSQVDIPGLPVGAQVAFRIQAINAYGPGPSSTTSKVTV